MTALLPTPGTRSGATQGERGRLNTGGALLGLSGLKGLL